MKYGLLPCTKSFLPKESPQHPNTLRPKGHKTCALFRCQKYTKFLLPLSARNAAVIVIAPYQVAIFGVSCWAIPIYLYSDMSVTELLCRGRNWKTSHLSHLLTVTELTRCDLGCLAILTYSSSLISMIWLVLSASPDATSFVFEFTFVL